MFHQASSVKEERRPYVIFYSPATTLISASLLPKNSTMPAPTAAAKAKKGRGKAASTSAPAKEKAKKDEVKVFCLPDWFYTKDQLKCVSIDVGIVNLTIRVEVRDFCNNKIYPVYFERVDLTKRCENTTKTTGTCNVGPDILAEANNFIDNIMQYIHDADLIGVERQLSENVKATKMFQHFISSFLWLIRKGYLNSDVLLFDIYSKLKYPQIGCPTEYNDHAKKKWGIGRALEILTDREDSWSVSVMNSNRGKAETKADDLADTVNQIEAWFIYIESHPDIATSQDDNNDDNDEC